MNYIGKLFLSISLLTMAIPAFAAQVPDETWKQTVAKLTQSRNAKVGGMVALGAIAGGAAYAGRDKIATAAKKFGTAVRNATTSAPEPVVATWQDVKEQADARYKTEQGLSIPGGTVVRTSLSILGIGATGGALILAKDKINLEPVKTWTTDQLTKAYASYDKLSENKKKAVFAGATAATAMLTAGAVYGVYKGVKALTKSSDVTFDPYNELRKTFTQERIEELKQNGVEVEALFETAQDDPMILFNAVELYNALNNTQKILLGQCIQSHVSENSLNNA